MKKILVFVLLVVSLMAGESDNQLHLGYLTKGKPEETSNNFTLNFTQQAQLTLDQMKNKLGAQIEKQFQESNQSENITDIKQELLQLKQKIKKLKEQSNIKQTANHNQIYASSTGNNTSNSNTIEQEAHNYKQSTTQSTVSQQTVQRFDPAPSQLEQSQPQSIVQHAQQVQLHKSVPQNTSSPRSNPQHVINHQISPSVDFQYNCRDTNSFMLGTICYCKPGYRNLSGICQKYQNQIEQVSIQIIKQTPTPSYIPTQYNQAQITHNYTQRTNRRYNRNRRPVTPPSLPQPVTPHQRPHPVTPHQLPFPVTPPVVVVEPTPPPQPSCFQNSHYDAGKKLCVCNDSYGLSVNNTCKQCQNPLISKDGYCVECPLLSAYDTETQKCQCVQQAVLTEGFCLKKCQHFEFYRKKTKLCQCMFGFGRIDNGKCQRCPHGYVLQNKTCTECSLNQTSLFGQCVCKSGYFKVNESCSKCDQLSQNHFSNEVCFFCSPQYEWINDTCQKIQENTSEPTEPQTPQPSGSPTNSLAKSQSSLASLSLDKQVTCNNNYIYITLDIHRKISFKDKDTMKNFIKSSFEDCVPPTTYCNQRESPMQNLFDCLLIFPSGVPNKKFSATFGYEHEGDKDQLTIGVDPLEILAKIQLQRKKSRRSRY